MENNFIIDRRNLFDQPMKIDLKTDDNIRTIAAVQGSGYTTGCLLIKVFYQILSVVLMMKIFFYINY